MLELVPMTLREANAYEEACNTDWWHRKRETADKFDRLLDALPDRALVE